MRTDDPRSTNPPSRARNPKDDRITMENLQRRLNRIFADSYAKNSEIDELWKRNMIDGPDIIRSRSSIRRRAEIEISVAIAAWGE